MHIVVEVGGWARIGLGGCETLNTSFERGRMSMSPLKVLECERRKRKEYLGYWLML